MNANLVIKLKEISDVLDAMKEEEYPDQIFDKFINGKEIYREMTDDEVKEFFPIAWAVGEIKKLTDANQTKTHENTRKRPRKDR